MTHKIEQLLKGLDVLKANGTDRISTHMLRATSEIIAPSLTSLFNLQYLLLKATYLNRGSQLDLCRFPNQHLNIVHLGSDQ